MCPELEGLIETIPKREVPRVCARLLFPLTNEQEQLLQPRPVAGGNTQWRQGWSGACKGWDDSSASVSPLQNPEQLSDERVATALCTMQDHVQQVTVMTHRRCRQNALRAHSLKKKKKIRLTGAMEALTSARALQEDARCILGQKSNEAAVVETIYTNALQDIFGKAEGLEKRVKTVTLRADSLITTESEFLPKRSSSDTKKLRTT